MATRRGKTVEETYQKKTQLEHILLRPDTYVGAIEAQQQDLWVFDERSGEIVNRKINYVPALYKIFDEILVNAADNMVRDPRGMDLIEVTVDAGRGFVSVMNNGQGIPVQIHKVHNCYVPELIFGHLLTSDNYDDNEKKVTGGRNGYGAKLANVFSTKFVIETADKRAKKQYKQVFEANMSKTHPPEIKEYSGNEFTRVTFYPDLRRFGMTRMDDDITSLMMKRVYDIAGTTDRRCRVVLNGRQLPVSCFQDYVNLYVKQNEDLGAACIYERCNARWEIAVSVTDGAFQQVSFVNSINTMKGGTHVAHIADQLVEVVLKAVKSKNKGGIDIKPAMVRNHLWIFVNCQIENPAFDSQTKETLTSKQNRFGSTCDISEKTLKAVLKSGIVETILDWVKAKEKVDMSRQLRAGKGNATRVLGIPKLEDANWAGGKNSAECTLILTEGDSAKSLAVAGLGVIGRDRFGVFPLKGKVLNVREANYKQVTGNNEIQSLLKIIGLDIKREYDSVCDLRYGHVMIMTDQDHDGSHIKGLLINLVHHWWPSLLRLGFLKEFVTPIVKVWKEGRKDGQRNNERSFFTMQEYHTWKSANNGGHGWKSKYYKGLGTSTMKEAKEYFRDIDDHEIGFRWTGEEDGHAIDLAFNKKRADDRKEWINRYRDGDDVDHSQKTLGYSDFIHKELVQFARYDVMRSIPSVVDGLKPSQRKVLYAAFKKNLKSDIKVAQFVGYISEHAAYHHGEASLENTVVNLAQNFVGSNNVNLLVPSGQFGTRLQGGKDHAAARYIYTRLSPATRLIFHPDDDRLLEYLEEEGQRIEPKWYCPVLPLVLVNGADGIGVGWSTQIPNHNPREIILNIRRMLRGQAMRPMNPWYHNFKGTITPHETEVDRLEVVGVAQSSGDSVEITELPVKVWTQGYKEFLEGLMPEDGRRKGDGSNHIVDDFREYHTENTVRFVVKLARDQREKVSRQGLEKTFKLKTSMATSNMFLFNHEGRITRYGSALEILEDFCILRHEMYLKRKNFLVGKLTREKEILSNKARFILMVVQGELELRRRKKAELLTELKRLGFKGMSELNAIERGLASATEAEAAHPEEEQAPAEEGADKSDYDYLLGMALWSLTFEKVEEIKKLLAAKAAELDALLATSIEQLWDRDLVALSAELDRLDAEEAQEAAAAARLGAGAAGPGGRRRRGRQAGPGAHAEESAATPSSSSTAPRPRPDPAAEELNRMPVRDCAAALRQRAAALRATRDGRLAPSAAAPAVDLQEGGAAQRERALPHAGGFGRFFGGRAPASGCNAAEAGAAAQLGEVVDLEEADAVSPGRLRLGQPPGGGYSAAAGAALATSTSRDVGRAPAPPAGAPFFTPLAPDRVVAAPRRLHFLSSSSPPAVSSTNRASPLIDLGPPARGSGMGAPGGWDSGRVIDLGNAARGAAMGAPGGLDSGRVVDLGISAREAAMGVSGASDSGRVIDFGSSARGTAMADPGELRSGRIRIPGTSLFDLNAEAPQRISFGSDGPDAQPHLPQASLTETVSDSDDEAPLKRRRRKRRVFGDDDDDEDVEVLA